MASFLDLPHPLRLSIYSLSGLIRPCPIILTDPPTGHQDREILVRRPTMTPSMICRYRLKELGRSHLHGMPECVCPAFPLQLLHVSKAFYADALTVLYGNNKFIMRGHEGRDVGLLLKVFTKEALSHVRELMVRLNCWPCRRGHHEADSRGCFTCRADISSADPPLKLGRQSSDEILEEWHNVCSTLAQCLPPNQLALTLISDVIDIPTTDSVISSLHVLPTLKSLTLRLGHHIHPILRTLARSTASAVTQRASTPPTFPFTRLPPELRQHILSFTDLAPNTHHASQHATLRIERNKLVLRRNAGPGIPILRRECCERCTFSGVDCCCPTLYSSYSPSCQCRVIPMDLFLVSRQMREDAAKVLFSLNCLEFHQQELGMTLEFLRALSPTSLTQIRRIRFMFSTEETSAWASSPKIRETWRRILALLRDNVTVSNFTLVVDTSWDWDTCLYQDEEDENRPFYDAYIDIARAVKEVLPKPLDCHFILGWFWPLEPELEKWVMGQGYDAWKGNRDDKVLVQERSPRGLAWITPGWHRHSDWRGDA